VTVLAQGSRAARDAPKGANAPNGASRWIGIGAGALACISAVWWLPYYPLWSITYVALGALVVYALAAHGGEAVV
jgi:hypothetical protein